MVPLLQRLLVLLVVGLTLTIVTDAPAHAACTCQRRSVAQQVERADAVFSGTVTMASGPTTSGKQQLMSYDVKVDRVYKGDITSQTVTVKSNADPAKCGLTGMTADTRYLVFVRANAQGTFVADRCSGTAPATSTKTQKVVAILGEGSTPVPPKPDKATYTRVADSDPPDLLRIAAPGAAMVLVGLLGLMVFAALGRTRRT
jgi:hypothetical protein